MSEDGIQWNRPNLAPHEACGSKHSSIVIPAEYHDGEDHLETMLYDPDLHLFLDDNEIQQAVRLSRVLNTPRRRDEPVLRADKPWEDGCRAQAWGSVLREPDGLFRMWYFAFNPSRKSGTERNGGYCYAESTDGVYWDKPCLGVVDWNGSRDNNLFFTFSPDGENILWYELAAAANGLPVRDDKGHQIGVVNSMDGLTVLRDETEPDPSRRYKLIANMQDHRMWAPWYPERYPRVTEEEVRSAREVFGQYLTTSPDGIHWSTEPELLTRSAAGDYMMAAYNERTGEWLINERPKALSGRNVGLRRSANLADWPDQPETVFSNDSESAFGALWEWHGGITPFAYADLDVGFLEKWSNSGAFDYCELVSHRDGEPWKRVAPGEPFLRTGHERSFDRALAYPTHNAPIHVGDELYVYYTGMGAETADGENMAIGLATIGLDRFAGLGHTRGEAGMVLTKSFSLMHDTLSVNVEPLVNAGVRVAVRTEANEDIPGYSLDVCPRISNDGVRIKVEWSDNRNLASLRGRKIMLAFEVSGAILYGFRLASEGKRETPR